MKQLLHQFAETYPLTSICMLALLTITLPAIAVMLINRTKRKKKKQYMPDDYGLYEEMF